MTPAEAAALLTIAAGFDNRKPDADQARAWAMALDGYRFEDCRDAIVGYYREHREWMMPADVIGRVKRVRNARVNAYGTLPEPPAHINPDDTAAVQRWRLDFIRGIGDGVHTTDNPQIGPRHRGPWEDEPSVELEAADAAERIRHIRSTLARRPPATPPPTLTEAAASAQAADTARARAARDTIEEDA